MKEARLGEENGRCVHSEDDFPMTPLFKPQTYSLGEETGVRDFNVQGSGGSV